jgi:hypothetical protein
MERIGFINVVCENCYLSKKKKNVVCENCYDEMVPQRLKSEIGTLYNSS